MMHPPVLWIGGPPGAGKTTVARLIARRRGLRWYNADAHTWAHRDRALAAGHPAARRFEELPPAERWSAPPDELLAMSLHHERGAMIAADVRALPAAPLTLAEGTPVTPRVTGVGDGVVDHAVWLLPTPQVQRERLTQRGMQNRGIKNRGTRELYELLVSEIETDVTAYGGRIVRVDGVSTVEETTAQVEALFAAVLADGPAARTAAERRALLRYANRAVVDQYLAYFARPWTTGEPGTTVRTFACECGAADCEADVDRPVSDAAAGPVLASGHAPA